MLSERLYDRELYGSYAKLTRYNQHFIKGQIEFWLRQLEQNDLDWRVYHPEHGHIKKEDQKVLEGKWSEVVGKMGAKFWEGTNKVWSGEPEVFTMYDQNPDYGYRLEGDNDGK